MNSLVESATVPGRDSIGSIHRHSSNSFSSKSSNALASNIKDPLRDLEKFTKYFVIKAVQVIVQSRIRAFKKKRTESQPNGNDWFNLNIKDIPEISDKAKKLLDFDGFNLKSNWKLCCEISLRSHDGGQVILEHWVINHRSLLKNYLSSLREVNQLENNNQIGRSLSPKSGIRNSSSSISGGSINGQHGTLNPTSTGRVRNATFSGGSRTRLNSIDDETFSARTKTPNGKTNDIKPSTSCYTLSNTPSNGIDEVNSDHHHNSNSNINTPSPNHHQSSPNNGINTISTYSKNRTLSNVLSTIHLSTIYNRMTLLLKSILTTSHIVPAYQLVTGIKDEDQCEINYRLYMSNMQQSPSSPSSNLNNVSSAAATVRVGPRGSIEDISNGRNGSGSPNRRSSISSGGSPSSVNIREFVSPHDLDHFCPMLNLGSAKSELNEMDVYLSYRTDVRNPFHLVKSTKSRGLYGTMMDRDCITAAKQLLAGNELKTKAARQLEFGSDGRTNNNLANNSSMINKADEPLRPAFANIADKTDKTNNTSEDNSFDLIEPMFDSLLNIKDENCNSYEVQNNTKNSNSNGSSKSETQSAGPRSQPIEAKSNPLRRITSTEPDIHNGSTPKSLTDSFVFVELNPPFASDDQNDINSFFHGPAPIFNNAYDGLKDAQAMTNQLADIEADASQMDEFVDNICMSEFEDEEDDQDNQTNQDERYK